MLTRCKTHLWGMIEANGQNAIRQRVEMKKRKLEPALDA
jgi:hypothetical protein